jgi:Transposase DDE domain group 1
MALNREILEQTESLDGSERVVLDMDSSESPVHGEQEGSACNRHFESVCYHPRFLFDHHGDCLAANLRPGNVPGAEDWEELLLAELDRQQAEGTAIGAKWSEAGVRENASERKFSRLDINANWVWPPSELEDEATRDNLLDLAKCWV